MKSGIPPQGPTALPNQHAIYFDGSSLYFSEMLLAAVAREFSEHSIIRSDDARNGYHSEIDLALVAPDRGKDFDAAVAALAELSPTARLVFCYDDPENGRALFKEHSPRIAANEISLMPMNVRLEAWISYLRLFLLGQSHISSELIFPCERNHFRSTQGHNASPMLQKLTSREAQILSLAAQGEQNKVIASQLNISEHTVKLHMHRVIRKLGVRNRTEAAHHFLSKTSS